MSIEWTASAKADLSAIIEYVALDNLEVAFKLADGIIDSTEGTLTQHPNAGRQGRVEGTREWVAHKHYVVVYRVAKGQKIQVLAVVHSARLWPQEF